MKKVCEIYDVSDDYEAFQGNSFIVVSEYENSYINAVIKTICISDTAIFNIDKWNKYLDIAREYGNNNSKFKMRRDRPLDSVINQVSDRKSNDPLSTLLSNVDNNSSVIRALNTLKEQPKKRLLLHYYEGQTYEQIANDESRHISSIYESIKGAKKKFIEEYKKLL